MKSTTLLSAVLFSCFIYPTNSFAQNAPVQGLFTRYERILQLENIVPVHSVSNQPFTFEYISRLDTTSGHPWSDLESPALRPLRTSAAQLTFLDPELNNYWRNLEPGGINDGAVWQGRGLTSSFSFGLFFKYHFLSVSVRPTYSYNQNTSFALSRYQTPVEKSTYSDPYYILDRPQRFGNDPFQTFDWGQTYIKADFGGMALGLSHQNMWWGPAVHYPIMMSNNAPGFWHAFIGTQTPQDVYIGKIDATLLWGKLNESKYFDQQSYNDERYITGLLLSFNPKPIPNLTLGFSRVFYEAIPPEGIPAGDLFQVFEAFTKIHFRSGGNAGGNDKSDQLLSFFGRWVFPKSGFELYGEWSRTDHSWDLRDALIEPEHSRGYMMGFQKTFDLANSNILALNAELIQLEASKTGAFRGYPTFYVHSYAEQGYTQKGQMLGDGIGPGSNSQLLTGKYYFKKGLISTWLRRTMYNNDFLYESNSMLRQPDNPKTDKYWLHNFEIGFGSSLTYFYKKLELSVGFELAREFNKEFIFKNDHANLALNIGLRYRLSNLR